MSKLASRKNGVVLPRVGSKARVVWDTATEISEYLGEPAKRSMVIEESVKKGISAVTAGTQFFYWRKFNGLTIPRNYEGVSVKHGATLPKEGTVSRTVWDIADKLTSEKGEPATRRDVIGESAKAGLNTVTAASQYGKWRQYKGLVKPQF